MMIIKRTLAATAAAAMLAVSVPQTSIAQQLTITYRGAARTA